MASAPVLNEEEALRRIQNSQEFKNLSRFFRKASNFSKAETIVKKKKKVSLRVVEYVASNAGKFIFNVHTHGAFRDLLDARGKKRFDVFRRHSRFTLTLGDKSFVTNLAQLRFLEFSISSGVIDWLLESKKNVKQAEEAMKKEAEIRKKQRKPGRKRRKRELKAVGCSNATFRF